ncbi:MAG: pirin family protein [Rectinemataceae bacterium]
MAKTRKIRKAYRSKPTIEGAGVHLRRAFGFGDVQSFDPFLLFDDFRSSDPRLYLKGFPWHPHRGIETITYVLSGRVEHGDSMGNSGVIGAGDVQWMTAGSGIIHQEMPKGDAGGIMDGFQLWANLPASQKMMDPRYRDVKADTIPSLTTGEGTLIRVVSGKVGETYGPVRDVVIGPEYLDVSVPAGGRFVHSVPAGNTAIAYVIAGSACFSDLEDPFSYDAEGLNYFDLKREPRPSDGTLILFDDGEQITVSAGDQGVRFIFLSGKPLREPVAWYGPIVMNTREQLQTAFEEYEKGTFIKSRG